MLTKHVPTLANSKRTYFPSSLSGEVLRGNHQVSLQHWLFRHSANGCQTFKKDQNYRFWLRCTSLWPSFWGFNWWTTQFCGCRNGNVFKLYIILTEVHQKIRTQLYQLSVEVSSGQTLEHHFSPWTVLEMQGELTAPGLQRLIQEKFKQNFLLSKVKRLQYKLGWTAIGIYWINILIRNKMLCYGFTNRVCKARATGWKGMLRKHHFVWTKNINWIPGCIPASFAKRLYFALRHKVCIAYMWNTWSCRPSIVDLKTLEFAKS